jgi:hypothetical protein
MGFKKGTNTVTVYGVSGTTNIHSMFQDGLKNPALLLAGVVNAPNSNHIMALGKDGSKLGLLVVHPPLEPKGKDGFEAFDSKDAIKRFLFENVEFPPEKASLLWNCDYVKTWTRGLWDCPFTKPVKARNPNDYMVVCAGPVSDIKPAHWCWMACGHGGYKPVTEEIKLPANWKGLIR